MWQIAFFAGAHYTMTEPYLPWKTRKDGLCQEEGTRDGIKSRVICNGARGDSVVDGLTEIGINLATITISTLKTARTTHSQEHKLN